MNLVIGLILIGSFVLGLVSLFIASLRTDDTDNRLFIFALSCMWPVGILAGVVMVIMKLADVVKERKELAKQNARDLELTKEKLKQLEEKYKQLFEEASAAKLTKKKQKQFKPEEKVNYINRIYNNFLMEI